MKGHAVKEGVTFARVRGVHVQTQLEYVADDLDLGVCEFLHGARETEILVEFPNQRFGPVQGCLVQGGATVVRIRRLAQTWYYKVIYSTNWNNNRYKMYV